MTKHDEALELLDDTSTHGYRQRGYHSDVYMGPGAHLSRPEPGTTVCLISDTFGGYSEWLEEPDRPQHRRDMTNLETLLPKLTKAQLQHELEKRHCFVRVAERKRELTLQLMLVMLHRWWPIKVCA